MKKHRRSPLRPRPLFVEGLETRAMLAGNVTASVSGGTLFVTGDDLDNSVVIQQTGTARFTVVGATGGATTINGQAEGTAFLAANVRNFEIDLRGGDDSLALTNSTTFMANLEAELEGGAQAEAGLRADALTIRGNANIRGGEGDDTLAVQLRAGLNVLVDANAGSDNVVVEGSTTTALLINADTGNQTTDGDDLVRVRGVAATRGAITVNTFAGNDRITLTDDIAASVAVNSGVAVVNTGALDFDLVSAARVTTSGTFSIFTGGNIDSTVASAIDANFFLVVGGRADDEISVGSLFVVNASLVGEIGNDTIVVDDTVNAEDITIPLVVNASTTTVVTGLLHIDAGEGNDNVDVTGDAVFGMSLNNLNVWTFAGDDVVVVSNLDLTGNILFDLGAGNDDLATDTVAADGSIRAFLLAGDDTATLTATTAAAANTRARIFGGTGFDIFSDGGDNGAEGTAYFLAEFEDTIELIAGN